MASPLFSCVIPVKGARPYMDAALESLRNQGMDEELEIIVQDGDTEPDAGQSDALNKGFAKAKGEWLFWLNADDVLLPGALKTVKRHLHDSVSWIAGNVVYIDKDGKEICRKWEHGWKWAYDGLPVRVYGPSSFFRRELLERSGGFDVSLRYMMDTDLWCRFRQLGYWYQKVPEYTWGFRVWNGSLTSSDLRGETPAEMSAERSEIERRYSVRFGGWRKRMLHLSRIVDGSYLKSVLG